MTRGPTVPTYLYCVTGGAVPADVPNGLEDAVVRAVDVAGVTAWVSDAADTPVPATPEHLRTHDAVCNSALASGSTPLPMRFGQTFASDEALVEALRERAAKLAGRLARIAGCVEMRVVMSADPASPNRADAVDAAPVQAPGAGEGTAHLHRLARTARPELARRSACEQLNAMLEDTAGPLIVRGTGCVTGRGLVYAAHLVRRGDLARYRRAFARVADGSPSEPTLLGPFAPYSFADDG